MPVRDLVLDLDGTLVDSLPGIELSLRRAVDQHVSHLTVPDLRKHIGPPLGEIVQTLYPGLTESERAAVLAAFREHYDSEGYRLAMPFPGVSATLESLIALGCRLYLLTNKRAIPTGAILEALGWRDWFLDVITPDGNSQPPRGKAEAGRDLVSMRRLRERSSLLVGDSLEDFEAAKDCGLGFVYARYGYGRGVPAGQSIDRFGEIVSLLG